MYRRNSDSVQEEEKGDMLCQAACALQLPAVQLLVEKLGWNVDTCDDLVCSPCDNVASCTFASFAVYLPLYGFLFVPKGTHSLAASCNQRVLHVDLWTCSGRVKYPATATPATIEASDGASCCNCGVRETPLLNL